MALLHLLLLVQVASAVQVSTKNGKLKGDFIRTQTGTDYYVFRRIPYAKPIIANASSKDIQPVGKWVGVRDATIGWSSQKNATNDKQGSEDCLYLTVYTKKIRRWLPPTMVRTYRTSPVEVYFQGCGINFNRNQTKSETKNILKRDVVIVLVHLRQGLGEDAAKDQLLALEWIKNNIFSFCGDPQRVAVFQGHSALADIDIDRLPPGSTAT